jgi:hypothetical protein
MGAHQDDVMEVMYGAGGGSSGDGGDRKGVEGPHWGEGASVFVRGRPGTERPVVLPEHRSLGLIFVVRYTTLADAHPSQTKLAMEITSRISARPRRK